MTIIRLSYSIPPCKKLSSGLLLFSFFIFYFNLELFIIIKSDLLTDSIGFVTGKGVRFLFIIIFY